MWRGCGGASAAVAGVSRGTSARQGLRLMVSVAGNDADRDIGARVAGLLAGRPLGARAERLRA